MIRLTNKPADSCSQRISRMVRFRCAAFLLLLLMPTVGEPAQFRGNPVAGDLTDEELRQSRLSERLVHDGEMTRLLHLTRAELRGGRSAAAIASLRQILASPTDAFVVDPGESSGSLRLQAVRLLRSTPPTFQTAWRAAMEPYAARELTEVIPERDPELLRRTAMRFPLTNSGFAAHVIFVTSQLQTGDERLAAAAVAQFSQTYAETVFAQRALQALHRWSTLSASYPTPPTNTLPRNLAAPIAQPLQDYSLSRPWPVSRWSWRDTATDIPLAMQPAIVDALDSFTSNNLTGGGGFSNHSPLHWNKLLIHRTPIRVAAISRVDGRVEWQIPTDTLVDQSDSRPGMRLDGMQRSFGTATGESLQFGLCGMVAADADMLFFIDGFDLLSGTRGSSYSRSIFRNGGRPFVPADALNQPLPERRNGILGNRIVALARRSKSPPVVAWIAGDVPQQPYQVFGGGAVAVRTAASTGVDSAEDESDRSPLDGHRFYSVPCGHSGNIYVLSIAEEQVWLNRLQKSNGHVVWQQPICIKPDSLIGVDSGWVTSAAIGSCVPAGDAIVCCIPDGMVVSVSELTGNLNWATTIESATNRSRLPRFSLVQSHTDQDAFFTPVLQDGRLIWSSPVSDDVYCLNATNGDTIWQVNKQAAGPGNIASSEDRYCAGIVGQQAVMIGEHHCRALDLNNGIQNWSAELDDQTGRSVVDGTQCLIPEGRGGLTLVDLASGQVSRVRSEFLPAGIDPACGAVTVDEQFVTVCTPGTITQFDRADVLLSNPDDQRAALGPIERAQAVLLASGRTAALRELENAAASPSASLIYNQIANLAAELILQGIGQQLFQNHDGRLQKTIPMIHDWDRLASLPLSPSQRVRAKLMQQFALPADGKTDNWDGDDNDFVTEWRTVQSLDGDWHVRPDIFLPEAKLPLAAPTVSGASHARSPERPADVILFAAQGSSLDQHLNRIREWSRVGHAAAAEMLASVLLRKADATEQIEIIQTLAASQSLPPVAGDGQGSNADLDAGVANNLLGESPFVPKGNYVVSEQQIIANESSMISEITDRHTNVNLMYDDSILLYLTGSRTGTALGSMDLRHGAVVDRVEIGEIQSKLGRPAITGQQPGLIVTAGDSSLGAIHCRRDGRLSQLWIRRITPAEGEQSVRRLGAFGSDYLMWQSETRLHCSHPLTGEDIWNREATCVEPGVLMLSPPMLFGNEAVTVTIGADLRSWRRYSTRSGRFLGSGRMNLDRAQSIIASGSRLIGMNPGSAELRIYDFEHDRDVLTAQEPIVLAGDSTYRQLPSGRIVAITRSREIVVVDPDDGKVVCRSSVAGTLNTGFVFGFIAFERNGRLLVAINDERGFGENISASPRLNEPRCDFGRLYCIDPQTGQIEWHHRTEPTVFPVVHGADVLIGWSIVTREMGIQRRTGPRHLRLQIRDLRSGQLLGESDNLSPEIPFLCHADRQSGQLTIETSGSRIFASPAVLPTGEF